MQTKFMRRNSWGKVIQRSVSTKHLQSNTHTVFNQAQVLENYNAFESDPCLVEAVRDAQWAVPHLTAFGKMTGSSEWLYKAKKANVVSPILHTHNRFGEREDTVEFHPYYHDLMNLGLTNGVSAYAWK